MKNLQLRKLIEFIDNQSTIISKERLFLGWIIKTLFNQGIITINDYEDLLKKNNITHLHEESDIEKISEDFNFLDDIESTDICFAADNFLQNRENTGSYYTPPYIVDYMINNSLINYLIEKHDFHNNRINNLINNNDISSLTNTERKQIINILKNLKIVDIACGSGLFLIQAYNKLYNLYSKLSMDPFCDKYKIKIEIIKNNLYGFDIQSYPLQVFMLAIIKDLSKYPKFNIIDLDFNIFQMNTILGEEIYKIERIQEIISTRKFDIVVGNPPYIGEKGNRELFTKTKEYDFGQKYYEGKMDYFYYFIYKGVELLTNNGILTYITTNYFITADGAKKLREFLRLNTTFKTIINFNECYIFKGAKGQHNMIYTIAKGKNDSTPIEIKYFNSKKYSQNEIQHILIGKPGIGQDISTYKTKNQNEIFGNNGNMVLFSNKRFGDIINKIKSRSDHKLGSICNVNQGLVSGADKLNKRIIANKSQYLYDDFNPGEGIFVLEETELKNKNLLYCKLIKPFYKNSDIKKYYASTNAKAFILYLNDNNIHEDEFCPAINKHLIKYIKILDQRREVKNGTRKWYALQWYRDPSIFENPKILVPQRSKLNNFGYSENPWYASADVYYITKKESSIDLKLILAVLNSKITYFWLYNMGKRKGNDLELYSKPLTEIPLLLKLSEEDKENIIKHVNKSLKANDNNYNKLKIDHYQNIIDQVLYSYYGFENNEIKLIEELYRQANMN